MWQVVSLGAEGLGALFSRLSSSVSGVVTEVSSIAGSVIGRVRIMGMSSFSTDAAYQTALRVGKEELASRLLRKMYDTDHRKGVVRGPSSIKMYLGRRPNKCSADEIVGGAGLTLRRKRDITHPSRDTFGFYPAVEGTDAVERAINRLMDNNSIQGQDYNRRANEVLESIHRRVAKGSNASWHKRGNLGGLPIEGQPLIVMPVDIATRYSKLRLRDRLTVRRQLYNYLTL